jgi:uncharacterized protein YjiS (DUF1127 family)
MNATTTTTTATIRTPRDLPGRPGGAHAGVPGAGLGLRLAAALAGAARGGAAALRLWRERARQRRQLAAMDDRLLQDIGLSRAQVEAEFQKPFWRP